MDTTTTPAGPAAPKQDGRDLQFQNYAETARQEREMLQGSADGEAWEEVRGTPWRPTHAGAAFVFRGELWFAPGNDIWYDTDPQSGAERAHWHAAEVWRLGRKPRL